MTAKIAIMLQVAEDSVTSPSTKRNCRWAFRDFLAWHDGGNHGPLTRVTVQRYAAELADAGLSPSNVNQPLSAIRKLAHKGGVPLEQIQLSLGHASVHHRAVRGRRAGPDRRTVWSATTEGGAVSQARC